MHAVGLDGPERLAVVGDDGLRRVDGEEGTVLDEGDAVALHGLVHVGRRDDDGQAEVLLQLLQHLPELFAADGIHTRCRLVEEQHMGCMYQGARESEFLLHTAGELACLALLERLYLTVDVLHEVVVLLDGGVEHGGEETQVLLDRHVLIEREAARHVADVLADLLVVLHHVEPIHYGLARVGQQQGGEDAEQRGLASSVGTDESENLALLHVERHTLQRLHLALFVGHHEVVYTNDCHNSKL